MEGVRSDPLVEIVLAEGAGTTADEALRDAFRNSVRQVVGVYVDSDTCVKNDQVISDQVLTYSDGIVTKYQEVSQKSDGGLCRVKIKAAVERRAVVARLKTANVTVREINGKGLFAEARTQLDQEKDGRKLLLNALQGCPANVVKAEVVGKPRSKNNTETAGTLACGVSLCVDQGNDSAFRKLTPDEGKKLDSIRCVVQPPAPRDAAGNGSSPVHRPAALSSAGAEKETRRVPIMASGIRE